MVGDIVTGEFKYHDGNIDLLCLYTYSQMPPLQTSLTKTVNVNIATIHEFTFLYRKMC